MLYVAYNPKTNKFYSHNSQKFFYEGIENATTYKHKETLQKHLNKINNLAAYSNWQEVLNSLTDIEIREVEVKLK